MPSPETHQFQDDGTIPNSPLPLLVYRASVPPDPAAIERIFADHRWPPRWRNGVYPWHHFHPHAHEALGVAAGHARVLFGGPNGTEVVLNAGDVVVVPAGVGHCAITASPDLLIVGAYPEGTRDTTASRGEKAAAEAVAVVPHPGADPVAGVTGPLMRLWQPG